MNVQEHLGIVEVWMTNAEKDDPAVRARLADLCAEYRGKKYTVAVFRSGCGDLYRNTHELLAYNKRKCVEKGG